ncbi:MAG: hypothetical protein HON23_07475 [Rickettsiales bacterium]|jgi:dihydrofolate synthase / folylpolyglutamate synthase|nr:hypothetical protein [Rickettsiales bacterium]
MQINEIFWPNFLGAHDIEMGLDRVLDFAIAVGNPQKYLKNLVHVAGTNGKGSTISFLEAMLRSAGYSVNVYTSPHLVHFNERIKLNGYYISDSELIGILKRCQEIEEKQPGKVTFFEGTTMAALLAFAKFPADFTLIETGLGGRLDATNIFEHKLLSIITFIAQDHEEYLGSDILGIAGEKAAIMDNSDVVILAKQDANVQQFLINYAEKRDKTIMESGEVCKDLLVQDLPLLGAHQIDNFKAAFTALTLLVGIEKAKVGYDGYKRYFAWPARMQEILFKDVVSRLKPGSKVYLDGAHNVAAGSKIAEYLGPESHKYAKIYLICNQTKDRNIEEFLAEFSNINLDCYSYHFDHTRPFYKESELRDMLGNTHKGGFYNWDDVWKLDRGNSLFLICGSLFLAGHFLANYS